MAIDYRYQDYLTLDEEPVYDAVLLIYGEYCVFNPNQRRRLLANVRQALEAGGTFAFDVTTPNLTCHQGEHTDWQALETGFWREEPHLVLTQGFAYPEEAIYLDQYLVIEANGNLSVYRNWFQDFDRARIMGEIEASGLAVQGVWADLAGTPYSLESDWIGILAQKPG